MPDNGLERNRQDAYQVYTGYGDAKMWVGGYQEGQRPGDLYMFIADGIYKSQDEIPAGLIDITSGNNGSTGRPLYGGAEGYNKLSDSQKENALPIQPGDVKWKDVNEVDRRFQYYGELERLDVIGAFRLCFRVQSGRLEINVDYGLRARYI